MKYLVSAKEVLENRWFLAIRSTRKDERYNVEDECRESYEWDFENDCSAYFTTGELAGGTCGIGIDTDCDSPEELAERIESALVAFNRIGYGDVGGQTILIAGRSMDRDHAVDDNEVRIRGAWVQEIVGE